MFCMSAVGRLVSCAVTQEITGWNGLLTMRIPHLHSALLKDRKTPPSCVEIEQPVVPPMNSLHLMDFLSWRKEVTISHCKKKQQEKNNSSILRYSLRLSPCQTLSRFACQSPCQGSVCPLPVMKSSETEILWSELTSHVTGAWHIDELSCFALCGAWLCSLLAPDRRLSRAEQGCMPPACSEVRWGFNDISKYNPGLPLRAVWITVRMEKSSDFVGNWTWIKERMCSYIRWLIFGKLGDNTVISSLFVH